jgi:hypothetical protein
MKAIMNGNNNFSVNLSIRDEGNLEKCRALMKTLFGAQKVQEVVHNGHEEFDANSLDTQRTSLKDAKKKACNALFYIKKCIDSHIFTCYPIHKGIEPHPRPASLSDSGILAPSLRRIIFLIKKEFFSNPEDNL